MTYKGYEGLVQFDEEAGLLHGEVINLRDVVTFQGSSVAEVTQAFHDSVDDYLEFCASRGEDPEKPFSGKLLVRIKPDLHRDLNKLARLSHRSVNTLASEALEQYVAKGLEPVMCYSGSAT